ncbi:MAG: dephospho-CoA kinase [Aestuariibacter sp.]
MSRLIIGLTGGIGSGKTTVSDSFAELGIDIVDADVIAREVVEPGTPALQEIVAKFGSDVINSSGELDRSKLRQHVFQNDSDKQWLNALLHPIIRQEMLRQCQAATSPYVILSVPLLIENKLQALVDRVLVVDCSEQMQITRGSQRDGVGAEQIKRIMQSQCSRETRLQFADDIVDNSTTIEAVNQQVNALNRNYLQLIAD